MAAVCVWVDAGVSRCRNGNVGRKRKADVAAKNWWRHCWNTAALKWRLLPNICFYLIFPCTSWGGCWSLSQLRAGRDRVHPWMSRRFITGPHSSIFKASVPCLRVPWQCSESVLAPLPLPQDLPTFSVQLNQCWPDSSLYLLLCGQKNLTW